ncbi:MAG: hypothetical protein JKY65_08945 [Planctomycetes bacterium]|nr:hypothetical protein [Planctomycetota bacterium]
MGNRPLAAREYPQAHGGGDLIGTPSYMAPEQAMGEEAGPAADAYALGGLLYFALTGRPPLIRGTVLELLEAVILDDPPRPSEASPKPIPVDLEQLVLALLAKDASRRPSLAQAERLLMGGEVIRSRLKPRLAGLALLIALGVLGLVALSVRGESSLAVASSAYAALEAEKLHPARLGLRPEELPNAALLERANRLLDDLEGAGLDKQQLAVRRRRLAAYDALRRGVSPPHGPGLALRIARARQLASSGNPDAARRELSRFDPKSAPTHPLELLSHAIYSIELSRPADLAGLLENAGDSEVLRAAVRARAVQGITDRIARIPNDDQVFPHRADPILLLERALRDAGGVGRALAEARLSGLERGAPRWERFLVKADLARVRAGGEALEQLCPKGPGPKLRGVLEAAIRGWVPGPADRGALPALNEESGVAVDKSLCLDEHLSYLDLSKPSVLELREWVRDLRVVHANRERSTRLALFLTRVGSERSWSGVSDQIDPEVVEAFLSRHPGSQAGLLVQLSTEEGPDPAFVRAKGEEILAGRIHDLSDPYRAHLDGRLAQAISQTFSTGEAGLREAESLLDLCAEAETRRPPEAEAGATWQKLTVAAVAAEEVLGHHERIEGHWLTLVARLEAELARKEQEQDVRQAHDRRLFLARSLLNLGRVQAQGGRVVAGLRKVVDGRKRLEAMNRARDIAEARYYERQIRRRLAGYESEWVALDLEEDPTKVRVSVKSAERAMVLAIALEHEGFLRALLEAAIESSQLRPQGKDRTGAWARAFSSREAGQVREIAAGLGFPLGAEKR